MNRQHEIEPSRQDEEDWLCTVEFLPSDDLEGRVFAADIVGYLFGYAQLRMHALWHSSAILRLARTSYFFPFRRLDKDQFLDLVRSNEDMGSDYIENNFMSPTTE